IRLGSRHSIPAPLRGVPRFAAHEHGVELLEQVLEIDLGVYHDPVVAALGISDVAIETHRARKDYASHRSLSSWSRKPRWPGRIFRFAVAMSNQAARSISGNSRPLKTNVLLRTCAGSPSNCTAQACTILPLFCLSGVSS